MRSKVHSSRVNINKRFRYDSFLYDESGTLRVIKALCTILVLFHLLGLVWQTSKQCPQGSTRGIYPRLIGGMGNQMFILSSAAIAGRNTGLQVFVNAKQTGVFSYGVPQPVFWYTTFHSDLFVKTADYDEGLALRLNETQFRAAMIDGFKGYVDPCAGVYLDGAFLTFEYNFEYRDFLLQLYAPTVEVQRWVNDAAVQLGLALRGVTSSLSASYFDREFARTGLAHAGTGSRKHIIHENATGGGWSCDWPPSRCEREIKQFECASRNCKDNVAIHIRLQDRSTTSDYWDESHLEKVAVLIQQVIAEGAHVVVFSNDPIRAKSLLRSQHQTSDLPSSALRFSSSIDVIEFGLMSQFFGTHILTGSTYQLWAIFLTPLKHVNVMLLEGIDDIGFVTQAKRFLPDLYTFTTI